MNITIIDLFSYTHHAVIELTPYGERHVINCAPLLEPYTIERYEGPRFLGYKTVHPKLYEVNEKDLVDFINRNIDTAVPEEEFEREAVEA